MIGNDDFCPCPFTSLVSTDNPVETLENTISLTSDILDSCNGTVCDHLSDVEVKTSAVVSILQDKLAQHMRHKIDSIEATTNKATIDVDNCLCKSLEAINETIKLISDKRDKDVRDSVSVATVPTIPDDKQTDGTVGSDTDKEQFISADTEYFYEIYADKRKCEFYYLNTAYQDAKPESEFIERHTDQTKAIKRTVELNSDRKYFLDRYKVKCAGDASFQLPGLIAPELRPLILGAIEATKKEIEEKGKEDSIRQTNRNIDWSANDICDGMNKWLSQGGQVLNNYLSNLLGFSDSKGNSTVPNWLKSISQDVPLVGTAIAELIKTLVMIPVNVADSLITSSFSSASCSFAVASPDIAQSILLDLVNKWLGINIPKVRENINLKLDSACPTMLPNVNELDDALLSGTISEKVWECLVRANNSVPERRWPILVGKRTRQSTYELLQLYLRGKIKENDLNTKLREIGWTADSELELQKELAWQTPSPSDLIPWMLRDVFDDDVVKEFGLDDEFKAKYTDKAKSLYRAAGVSDEIARYHWMAHWVNPSNTALFEMYHRLRGGEGNSGVFRYFDKDGNKLPEPIELTNEEMKVTEEQVARAIGVNDLSPFWRDKMLAISRPPLTRTDVRRAYEIDAMEPKEVYEAFRDLGYSHENANILLRFATKQKERGNVRKKGRILPSRIAIMYEHFSITKDEAVSLLQQTGLSKEDSEATIAVTDIKIKAATKQKCLKELRKRYMYGDIEESQLSKSLLDVGLSQEQAVEYVKSMKCERANRHKEATASQLCEWFGRNLITYDNYKIRLLRIGFSPQDVERIVAACDISVEEKLAKKTGHKQAKAPIPESKDNPAERK